jgi:ABC-type multidrug transport system ATPase subunit
VIIEEPSSVQDEDVKHLLDDTLARLALGRTLIILPHRLSTIRSCDQIILLHNGRVEDVGSPAQLQAESKLFRHLLYTEFNEFISGELEPVQLSTECREAPGRRGYRAARSASRNRQPSA